MNAPSAAGPQKSSATDWQRIRRMQDEDIDTSEIPEWSDQEAAGATLKFGGKPVPAQAARSLSP